MSFLQQPVLFASEPNSTLVGLGLIITLSAVAVVVSLLVAFAVSTRKGKSSEPTCDDQPVHLDSGAVCGEPALS